MGRGEVDSEAIISRELVVASRDGTKVLEFVEKAFDEVAFAIECEVAIPRKFAVGFWGNHRGYSPLSESVDQLICVVSLIAKQDIWIDAVDQLLRASQIGGLPRREHQFDRIAQGIDERMDFRRELENALENPAIGPPLKR